MSITESNGKNLLFSIAWSRYKHEFTEHISYLNQVNVVLHATPETKPCARQSFHALIYGRDPESCIPTSSGITPYSQGHTVSRAAHYRLNGGIAHGKKARQGYEAGKFLLFGTGNTIRAGKSTHAHAALAMYTFWNWVNRSANLPPARWPARLSAPNMVVTGQFKKMIDHAIKNDPAITWSVKFPGLAVTTDFGSTPELYLRQSRFIIPGVTSAEQLAQVLRTVVKLYCKYKTETSTTPSPVPNLSPESDIPLVFEREKV